MPFTEVSRRWLIRSGASVLLAGGLAACHRDDPGSAPVDGGLDDILMSLSSDAACATGGAAALLRRLDLVVVYDRSGSMGDGTNGDPTKKWLPVGAGLKSFFTDPGSVGVTASLQYFPYKQNDLEDCNSSAYYFPDVPLTALPSPVFGTDIDATTPAGQTPTLPAMQGGIAAAQDLLTKDPSAKIAIVLVTDGEPDQCGSSVNNVSGAAMAVAASIPTYVIGVGLSQDALAQISMAGGTGQPIIASVGDPAQTTSDILAALQSIRGLQIPCDFALPSPPDGKVLDTSTVNVLYTPGGGGAQQTLTYDPACTSGQGWYYDDPMNPKEVELCASTCSTIQKDTGASVDILFGCRTQGLL